MKLLLDAGNTRVKWAVVDGERWMAEGVFAHAEAHALRDTLKRFPALRQAFGVNVAGDCCGDALQQCASAHGVPLRWLVASPSQCGVTNLYEEPGQLGPDRWAALIGARALHAGPAIVVCAGTATTVDLLDAAGRFHGGLILPGEQLMRRSLARDTAQLPLADGDPQDPPRNTIDAIVTGCLYAQTGAIERMFARIATETDARCLLAGGNAPRLEPLLSIPVRRIDNLVLRGVAVLAASCEAAHG